MALPATESFTGSAGPLTTGWTQQINTIDRDGAGVGIGSNAGDYNGAFWSGDAFSASQYSKVKLQSFGGFAGVSVRASGTAGSRNAYYLLVGAVTTRIAKVVAGSIANLVAPGDMPDPAGGDVIELRISGTTLEAYYNGVKQTTSPATVTDSDLASGSAGIMVFATGSTFDDWEGGNLAAPSVAWLPVTGIAQGPMNIFVPSGMTPPDSA